MRLSIIIPAYNEEANIVSTIRAVYNTIKRIKGIDYEVLVVNDGSSDNTLIMAQQALKEGKNGRVISHAFNKGLGEAIKTGFANFTGDYAMLLDADLSYGPEYIIVLFNEIMKHQGFDIITTSPYMRRGRTKNIPFFRLMLSKLGNRVIAYAMNCPLHTVTSMVRIYKKKVVDSISLDSKAPEIQVEILSKAISLGYKVKEIPALLKGRKAGKSKFMLRSGVSNHLSFSLYEKPMMLFGLMGLLTLIAGIGLGIYATVLAFNGQLGSGRALVTLIMLLVTSGIIMLFFGFLANQIVFIKKELYKIQRQNKNLDLSLKKK